MLGDEATGCWLDSEAALLAVEESDGVEEGDWDSEAALLAVEEND